MLLVNLLLTHLRMSVFWDGVPRLACLRPAAWLKGWPSMAHLHQHKLKTLVRGQASRGGRHEASSGTASSGWLARRRRDQGGVPHEVPMTQAMTTEARRAPARVESLFPLWWKGGKRRQEDQGRRLARRVMKYEFYLLSYIICIEQFVVALFCFDFL